MTEGQLGGGRACLGRGGGALRSFSDSFLAVYSHMDAVCVQRQVQSRELGSDRVSATKELTIRKRGSSHKRINNLFLGTGTYTKTRIVGLRREKPEGTIISQKSTVIFYSAWGYLDT